MKWINIKDSIKVPADNRPILRYLNDIYSLDLLESSELYFSKAQIHTDVPNGNYSEGYLTIADQEWFRNKHKKSGKLDWQQKAEAEILLYQNFAKKTYISCWNASGMETRYMWNEYSKTLNGCIFCSNVEKLRKVLIEANYDYHFDIAEVEYIDPISDVWGIHNTTRLFARKITDYRNDEEIRAIIQLNDHLESPAFLRIKIDLNNLIERVVYKKTCDGHFIESITKFCSDNNIELIKSQL